MDKQSWHDKYAAPTRACQQGWIKSSQSSYVPNQSCAVQLFKSALWMAIGMVLLAIIIGLPAVSTLLADFVTLALR